MIGRAQASAAISIVNALPLGIGAALGIEWPARATASLDHDRSRGLSTSVEPRASATALVRSAARTAVARFDPGATGRLSLTVRSTIPVARGLKSSSAVSSSIALATARALGREPPVVEIAKIAADAGRSTGTSATGAFDDALAGLVPGGVVTDNRRDTELRRLDIGGDLAVALWIPARRHPPSPKVLRRFQRDLSLARRAADAALAGDWVAAMAANTALVESAMEYRYGPIHAAVDRAGATAAGVSGLGPTFAAVAPVSQIGRVLRALPRGSGRRRTVRLSAGGRGRGGRPR